MNSPSIRLLSIFSISILCSLTVKSQVLVSAELLGSLTVGEVLTLPGLPPPNNGLDFYKVVYNTTDGQGQPTIASGMFCAPNSPECTGFPFLVYMHGTTLNKENVPSRDNQEAAIGKFIAGQGYYACSPDYVGMGDSPGLHPYVHAASEATAGVDMVRACRELVSDQGGVDNGQVFITGYSQGGHAAMAMHKYIEDNALLDEFDITASAPASGPYDMSGSQTEVILSGAPYSNPGYLVYTLASYDLVYDNLYDEYADVLQSPYDGIVVPFFNGTNTSLNMGSLNAQLPNVVGDLMQADFLEDLENDDSHPLRLNLADNDLYDWTPTRPISMFYCTQDEQVPFSNSLTALTTMEANGSTVVEAIDLGPEDHAGCYLPAMLTAISGFIGLKEDCVTSIDENTLDLDFGPNPAVDFFTIGAKERLAKVVLYDIRGQEVSRSYPNSTQYRMDTSALAPGRYTLSITAATGATAIKALVKE